MTGEIRSIRDFGECKEAYGRLTNIIEQLENFPEYDLNSLSYPGKENDKISLTKEDYEEYLDYAIKLLYKLRKKFSLLGEQEIKKIND